MTSRSASSPHTDQAQTLTEFIDAFATESEPVASELDALRSIYGDEAIRIWDPSKNAGTSGSPMLRYEVETNLPSHPNIYIKVLVSLLPSYPAASPPQLQLLSRYIGAFSVSPELFGDVLKTFISTKSPVEFSSEALVVFDGLQHVMDICSLWYAERLNAETAGKLVREEGRSNHNLNIDSGPSTFEPQPTILRNQASVPAEIPAGVELFEAEAITDRKSVFIGRACRITHPSQVSSILSYLMADKRIGRAAHPIINAWRCNVDGVIHQDSDDDGETAAGGRLAHLLRILELDGVLVVVTRFFGGIHLGPDRFKHINQAARLALEKGHFLDVEEKTKKNSRSRKPH